MIQTLNARSAIRDQEKSDNLQWSVSCDRLGFGLGLRAKRGTFHWRLGMIVDPDFLTHWKTRLLISLLNYEAAPLCLIALWAHCQTRKTDRICVNRKQFASICRFPLVDMDDKFWDAMIECGWIEEKSGIIVVHDFAKTNGKLFANWNNGALGGRPSKTHEKPKSRVGKPNVGLEKPILSYLSNQSYLSSLLRVRQLFGKKDTTRMDVSEERAWKAAEKSVVATNEEDWALIEWAYKQTNGSACQFRRKDMATLLNNWNCEIDRARGWKNGNGDKTTSTLERRVGKDPLWKKYNP